MPGNWVSMITLSQAVSHIERQTLSTGEHHRKLAGILSEKYALNIDRQTSCESGDIKVLRDTDEMTSLHLTCSDHGITGQLSFDQTGNESIELAWGQLEQRRYKDGLHVFW